MNYLKSHEHDNYYLGTPYRSGNWRSPNGDRSYNGSAGMNCSGFVWHVLKSCIQRAGHNPSNYQVLSFTTPRGWYGVLEDNNIQYYVFNNKYEALRSGVMSKGDIIMMFCNSAMRPSGQNHIGIYWGDGSSDVFWHSAGRANYISVIRSGGAIVKFVVAKMKPSDGSLKISLKDQDGAALSGGKFGIYNSSGSLYRTVSAGESLRLPFGRYTVSQTEAPEGYKPDLSKKQISVTLKNPDFDLTFTNRKKCGAFIVGAKRSLYIPSEGKYRSVPIAGFVFDVFADEQCSEKITQITTGTNGVAVYGKSDGRYTLPEGAKYYIRPAQINEDSFKNIVIPQDQVFYAEIRTDATVGAVCENKDYILCSSLGAIRVNASAGETFWLFSDKDCTEPVISLNTDADNGSILLANTATAASSGTAYFGFDHSASGFGAYRLAPEKYFMLTESDEKVPLTVRGGCVTDALSGDCILELEKGDCDMNGSVTAADARLALRASARLESLYSEQFAAADLNADGKITASEARHLLRYTARLTEKL